MAINDFTVVTGNSYSLRLLQTGNLSTRTTSPNAPVYN